MKKDNYTWLFNLCIGILVVAGLIMLTVFILAHLQATPQTVTDTEIVSCFDGMQPGFALVCIIIMVVFVVLVCRVVSEEPL